MINSSKGRHIHVVLMLYSFRRSLSRNFVVCTMNAEIRGGLQKSIDKDGQTFHEAAMK
jgi:hypothetical protein